jgi:HK97 family phage major capsid protein
MDLLERRNTLADELARQADFEASLVTGPGFDPDSTQYTDAVHDRAYHVVQSAEPYLKADTVTLRPTPPAATYPTPVTDAATTVNVSGASYRYVTLPPIVTPGVVAENAPKPGVEFTSTEVSGTLQKVAYILDVTQETLEDEPQAQTILSQWLTAGIWRKVENDAAAAVTGGSGYLTVATPAGGNAAQAIRLSVATLQAQGLTANAALINPTDWANLDLYMFTAAGSNSSSVVQSNPWGVRLIAANAVAAGTIYVGDFKAGLLHIQRSSVGIDITDSGMSVETTPRDRFTNNLYGLRAEARYKTIVQQPKAIVKATITP